MRSVVLNKHQVKSEATRVAILDSAQKVFFRDGFESAQVSEIAKAAGRTSGSIYAQFENKEHLFMAVLERRMQEIADLGRKIIEKETAANPHLRVRAFRKYYTALYKPDWAILDIELKLYALRHPESMEKLKAISKRVWEGKHDELYDAKTRLQQSNIEARIVALGSVANGIVLGMHWEPNIMTLKQAKLIMGEVFDGLFSQDETKGVTPLSPRVAATSSLIPHSQNRLRKKK
ncbi:MAG: regulatory protein TetR [Acidobacteriaceae bacterium]|nr:regulatory protein TetR [Acidobacteriaceae bacterium]